MSDGQPSKQSDVAETSKNRHQKSLRKRYFPTLKRRLFARCGNDEQSLPFGHILVAKTLNNRCLLVIFQSPKRGINVAFWSFFSRENVEQPLPFGHFLVAKTLNSRCLLVTFNMLFGLFLCILTLLFGHILVAKRCILFLIMMTLYQSSLLVIFLSRIGCIFYHFLLCEQKTLNESITSMSQIGPTS